MHTYVHMYAGKCYIYKKKIKINIKKTQTQETIIN